jgi:hypothetical protein
MARKSNELNPTAGTDGLVKTNNHITADQMKMVKTQVAKQNGMKKFASGISVTPPSYYNPLYTPTSLQLPRDRKQINVWSFAGETPILMHDGSELPIKTLKVGDLVRSANNIIRPITHTYTHHVEKNMVTIKTSDGPLRVTEDHICYVIDSDDIEKINSINDISNFVKEKYASEINTGEYMFRAIPSSNYISSISDGDLAELLGAYLAEGYIYDKYIKKGVTYSRNVKVVELKYNKTEKNIVDNILELCSKLGFNCKIKDSKTSNTYRVWIKSTNFADLCERHCGRGSKTKRLSYDVLYASVDILQRFMNGYFDGSVLQFATASNILAQQLHSTVFPRLKIIDGYTNYKAGKNINGVGFNANHFHVPQRYANKFSESHCLKDSSVGVLTRNEKNFIHNNIIFHQVLDVVVEAYKGVVYDVTVGEDFNIIARGVSVRQCRHF